MHVTALRRLGTQWCATEAPINARFTVGCPLKLRLQCDTSTCELPPSLQRAYNCLCGAKRWLGVFHSDA